MSLRFDFTFLRRAIRPVPFITPWLACESSISKSAELIFQVSQHDIVACQTPASAAVCDTICERWPQIKSLIKQKFWLKWWIVRLATRAFIYPRHMPASASTAMLITMLANWLRKHRHSPRLVNERTTPRRLREFSSIEILVLTDKIAGRTRDANITLPFLVY